ncbi:ABC transporter ATP-binding protein [Bremerella sp. JC770]|uniref:ABC transporter ATP-binding protein n=1 Tax=Bremerella sp. JC770 TaxID=3232137 RepID=UPI00345B30CF
MQTDHILEIESVYKKFRRSSIAFSWGEIFDVVGSVLGRRIRPELREDEFYALNDVSLTISRGERVGLIGANGSGKSTLLKMVQGLILPTDGEIRIAGRLGALIELSAGLEPDLTGRENIYLRAALMGLSRKEIERKIEAIIEFSELEEFIDSPLRNYSSGMKVRLGFAVTSCIEPDLLVLDEVLAVGDYRFKQKCMGRINNLLEDASVILVSHSMNDIALVCNRVVVLDKGRIIYDGSVDEGLTTYMQCMNKASKKDDVDIKVLEERLGPTFENRERLTDLDFSLTRHGEPVEKVDLHDPLELTITFNLVKEVERLVVGIPIYGKDGKLVTALSSDRSSMRIKQNAGEIRLTVSFPNILGEGIYMTNVVIADGGETVFRQRGPRLIVSATKRMFGEFSPPQRWVANDCVSAPNGDMTDE